MSPETNTTATFGLKDEVRLWAYVAWLFWLCESLLLYFQVTFYEGAWSVIEGGNVLEADLKRFTPLDLISGLAVDFAAAAALCFAGIVLIRLVRKIPRAENISPPALHGTVFLTTLSFLYGAVVINFVLIPIGKSAQNTRYTLLWALASVLIGALIYLRLRSQEEKGSGPLAFWSLSIALIVCLFGVWPWMDFHAPTLLWQLPKGFAARIILLVVFLILERVILYVVLKRRESRETGAPKPSKLKTWLKRSAVAFPVALAAVLAVVETMPAKGLDTSEVVLTDKNPPNILLISMDTVRADALSCYSPETGNTPFLDSLAARGALFEDARSTSPWTLPGHASMFTGLYPSAHGATWEFTYLDDDFVTLAEILKAAGYQTAAFSSNGWISHFTNTIQGFDHYHLAGAPDKLDRKAKERPLLLWEATTKLAITVIKKRDLIKLPGPPKMRLSLLINRSIKSWLEERNKKDKPAFIFVNYVDGHHPYRPTKKFFPKPPPDVDIDKIKRFNQNLFLYFVGREKLTSQELEYLRSLYYASVSFEDYIIQSLFDILESSGFLNNVAVIVTADHGEYLGEHGQLCHVFGVHEPVIRVPFILYAPGRVQAGGRLRGMVQIVDVVPTLLELAGIQYKGASRFQAKSLLKPLKKGVPVRKYSISELMYPNIPLRMIKKLGALGETLKKWEVRQRTVTEGAHQFEIHSNDFSKLWLLENDGKNALDVTDTQSGRAKLMQNTHDKWLASFPHAKYSDKDKPVMTKEFRDMLRAMGYID